MAAPAATPKPQSPQERSGEKRPVTMTVQPKPTPPPREPDRTPPPDEPSGPWWQQKGWLLGLVAAIVLPGITVWLAGGFEPAVSPIKPYNPFQPNPTVMGVILVWAIMAIAPLVGGYALTRGWPIVLLVVGLAFVWTWFRFIVRLDTVHVGLLTEHQVLIFIGLVLGGVGQFIYSKLNP